MKTRRIEPGAPGLIHRILGALGVEVGDYHHPDSLIWVKDGRRAWGVKLEGWGPECVPGCGCQAARRGAEQLAREWREHMDQAGWLKVTESGEVWALTWGLVGPKPTGVLARVDPDDVLHLDG